MISFLISVAALVVGYLLYGSFVDRVFGPNPNLVTPAVAKADNVDFIAMPAWKVYMIQFLNIAGTGPIFGAIMGAKFGPSAYLWIVFGCIFAGAVHDYLSGMLSVRHGGAGYPVLVGRYLGETTKKAMLVFSVLLLLMVRWRSCRPCTGLPRIWRCWSPACHRPSALCCRRGGFRQGRRGGGPVSGCGYSFS